MTASPKGQARGLISQVTGQAGQPAPRVFMPACPAQSKPTPLHALHAKWNARLVDFAGWHLPLSYPSGTLAEHQATREGATLFDVSHMAQLVLRGERAAEALARILPADILGLAPGQSKYTVMLNHDGGAIDDLIVTNDGPRGLFIVANAARRQADLAHLRQNLPTDCELEEITDHALIAVQGPQAAKSLAPLLPQAGELPFMQAAWQSLPNATEVRVSRSGYTGEDGFEIALPAEAAAGFCRTLVQDHGVLPAGLGARDTLRIEAALCLYGHELGEDFSPLEAGLIWTIPKARRESADYIGGDALRRQLSSGPARKLVGIRPEGRGILRAGTALLSESGAQIGEISSGVFSPTLQAPIALGFVSPPEANIGEALFAEIRGKSFRSRICQTPFVPHRYAASQS